jgi:hypothetical protein
MVKRERTDAEIAAAFLTEAATKIEAAIVRLDMRHRQCECGAIHHHNKTHFKAYGRLTDLPRKLADVAADLLRDE